MKLLAWNCRGLSSPRAVRSLLEVQNRINPDVFFLSETHLDKVKADNVRRRAGFDHLIIHESDGRSGGLLLLWKEEVNIRLQAVTHNYIDVVIEENGGWRFTGVYGEPDWRHKARTWEAIRSIKGDLEGGGRPRTQRQLQAFHDALSECEVNDVGFVGDIYTWQRGHIRERLDRAVANIQWSNMFPQSSMTNSEMIRSDHRPILMDTQHLAPMQRGTRMRRFEARWLQEDTVEEMIEAAWAGAKSRGEIPTFLEKVGVVHDELHKWDREMLKKPEKRIKELKVDLERLRRGPITDANIAAQKEIMVRLELMLEQEEIHWMQRARENWLKKGG
ncbi:hypothetical protein PVAP13_3KG226670 [Panicum virgatum]|uniref:Endonuclease/exonuclease/phosphatase domain-containing protein n=1 Tax=Panicum virgatum TaxID=38727 RepID=A0A8T0URT1_PANVG|nr:hypothetical protein PVAP13_3KG226670 [Panicum virgatum]